MARVKRSCNADNVFSEEGITQEEALRASWKYWESRGLENPEKRESNKIQAIKPIPRTEAQ